MILSNLNVDSHELSIPDEMLFSFLAPLLPYILSDRVGMDPSLTQRYTSIFLAEGALASILSSPFIGSLSDRVSSKKLLLLLMLVLALGSTLCLALARSSMSAR